MIIYQTLLLLLGIIFWAIGETGMWHYNNIFQRIALKIKSPVLRRYFDPHWHEVSWQYMKSYPRFLRDSYHGGKVCAQLCFIEAILLPYPIDILGNLFMVLGFAGMIYVTHTLFFKYLLK